MPGPAELVQYRLLILEYQDPSLEKTYNINILYNTNDNKFIIYKIDDQELSSQQWLNLKDLISELELLLKPKAFAEQVDPSAIPLGFEIVIDDHAYDLKDVSTNPDQAEEFLEKLDHLPQPMHHVGGLLYFVFQDLEPAHTFGGSRKTATMAVKTRSPVRRRRHSVHKLDKTRRVRESKRSRTHSRSHSRKHRKQSKSARRRARR